MPDRELAPGISHTSRHHLSSTEYHVQGLVAKGFLPRAGALALTLRQATANVTACCASGGGQLSRERHEADVPAEPEQAETDPRLSETDEHRRRAEGAPKAPGQGTPATGGLSRGTHERHRLQRTARLLKAGDFARVLKAGRRLRTGPFTLHIARAGTHGARLGLAVGRRAGAAVVRNRIKRSLREQFRQHRSLFPPGTDLVVVVTRDLTSAKAAALRRAVAEAFQAAAGQSAGGTPHGTGESAAR